jgi:hypothetical protein
MQREFRIPKSTFRIQLFKMTLGAGGRAGGIAGLFLILMALDALLVHHLLRFQLAGYFHFFNGIGFLGKDSMAGVAVRQPILVAMMGKQYIPPGPAIDFKVFSALVRGLDGNGSRYESHDQQHE